MTATEIVKMLRVKHSEDVFVPECKNGPSQMMNHVRLDAWTMAKSWANPRMIGYEVKVSRGDFLQDTKWPAYLRLCNELYFVCPAKLIQPSEVPESAGLIWAGSRLLNKKKAPYREIDPPFDLLKYVLMSRVVIAEYDAHAGRNAGDKLERTERKRQWLEGLKKRQVVGWEIRGHLGQEIERLRSENAMLKQENERLAPVTKKLEELGYPRYATESSVVYASEKLKQEVPPELVRYTREMVIRLGTLADRFEMIHSKQI